MEKNEILTIIVIFIVAISIFSPAFFYFTLKTHSASGKATGQTSLTVVPTCGDDWCEDGFENCTNCPEDCGECIQICGDGLCTGTETCETCPEDCGICIVDPPGGGGGGGTPRARVNFKFIPDVLNEEIFIGEEITRIVNASNIGVERIDVSLRVSGLEEYLFLNNNIVSLGVGESKEFEVLISSGQSSVPNVYLGDIFGTAKNVERGLPVVLTLLDREAPIYVDVVIPSGQVVKPGETILADIKVTNEYGEEIDVDLENSIRSRLEEILLLKEGSVSLTPGENLFVDKFEIPLDTPEGYYFFYSNVTFNGVGYSDAAPFKVEVERERVTGLILDDYLIYLWILLFILILLIIIFLLRKMTSRHRRFFLLKKKKKKKEEKDFDKIILDTLSKLKRLKSKASKKYEYSITEEYISIMRSFFAKYYSIKSSLTFEEMVSTLDKKNVKSKSKTISFINRISHIPYYYTLMPKDKFFILLNDTNKLLSSYKGKSKKQENKTRKKKKKRKKK